MGIFCVSCYAGLGFVDTYGRLNDFLPLFGGVDVPLEQLVACRQSSAADGNEETSDEGSTESVFDDETTTKRAVGEECLPKALSSPSAHDPVGWPDVPVVVVK